MTLPIWSAYAFSLFAHHIADYYDISRLSRMHGAVLLAWTFIGLVDNNVSMSMFNATGGFYWLIWRQSSIA